MNNSPNKILLLLIIIIFGATGYFYYSQLAGEPEPPVAIPFSDSRTSLDSIASLSVDFSILDTDVFKLLQQYGESPVDKGVTGRKDIFAPAQ